MFMKRLPIYPPLHNCLIILILTFSLSGSYVKSMQSPFGVILTEEKSITKTKRGGREQDGLAKGSFRFERNLIFVTAELEGRSGTFILDTGAPGLLLNQRDRPVDGAIQEAIGANGPVKISKRRVEHFELGGLAFYRQPAFGLDLRAMEQRTGRRIDGFIGYDLFAGAELRIDYDRRSYSLHSSERNPTHLGREPTMTFKFRYVDHLPVITLRIEGKKLRLAIDTGASTCMIDRRVAARSGLFSDTGRLMNTQGLEGRQETFPLLTTGPPELLEGQITDLEFVSADMSHLQPKDGLTISGLLGSCFLSRFTVGVDYRRRKIYLW